MANVQHSILSGLDLHDDKSIKLAVRAASTGNVTLSTPGSTLDGVTLVNGDRILLKDQSSASDNGIYTWAGASNTLARTADANSGTLFFYGFSVFVREGSTNALTMWRYTQTAAVTLGATAITFVRVGTVTSVTLTVPTGFSVSGSPITGSGTLAITENTQSANQVKAGPTSGSAATPAYRALVSADLPSSPDFQIGTNGQKIGIRSLTELTTIAASATTTTTIQIPAGAIVLAVPVRVVTAIPTATTFTVTGNSSGTFNTAAISTAANTTDQGTAAGAFYSATTQSIKFTPNSTPGANTGQVRVTIFYLLSTPPTS